MAIFMTDDQLAKGLRECADRGELVQTAFNGFHAINGHHWNPATVEAMRWVFWAGARAVFDALERDVIATGDNSRFRKLSEELGRDPFCRPPRRDLQ